MSILALVVTAPAPVAATRRAPRVVAEVGRTRVGEGPADWEEVVTRLVSERGPALHRFAQFVSGNSDDAADLVQDALVKTFGRLRNGYTVASAEAYVRRAIVNSFLDDGRRRTRWRRISHLVGAPERIESATSTSESRLDLQHELSRLSPRERACIVLRYYEDLKVDDVARTLGISAGAVKRYLSDALAKLEEALSTGDEHSMHSPKRGGPHGW